MTKTNEFKNFSILSLILLVISAVFTFMLLSFHGGISILAFVVGILYLAVVVYFLFVQILKKTNGRFMTLTGRLVEFMPYIFFISFILRRAGDTGTSFVYDLITVLLWVSIFVLSILVSRKLDYKRCKKIVVGWAVPPVQKKYTGIGKFFYEVGDWCYTILWALFTVMIFQIFVIQLYKIPSESMVPTFLVNDKAFVSKIDCGPKFPLTDIGLPTFRKYKRGDTVVLRNPHYSMDRKAEVKTVTSQLVSMLTFMTVQLNTDENGVQKADPLVKRITGVPGEQLVMQDGVLYTRTKDSDKFVKCEKDEEYAMWNLNELPRDVYNKVRTHLFTNDDYKRMLDFEATRRDFDLEAASIEAQQIVNNFNKSVGNNKTEDSFTAPVLLENSLFSNINDIAYNLFSQDGGSEWFENFMTSWIPAKNNERDVYSEANFKLNVMTKITFGRIVSKIADSFDSGDFSSIQNDEDFNKWLYDAEVLNWYIQGLLDSRNMPVFPANDEMGNPQYIPEKCYFMMGDNRFNSLDLRHSNDRFEKALTSEDPMSVTYYSMMKPQYINKKYIIGKPLFRFWPVNRIGKV